MKILIFSAFDGLPYSGETPMRYAALIDALIKNGHEIIYLTASYAHHLKKYRKAPVPPKNVEIVLLHTKAYAYNKSIDRVLSHYRLSLTLSTWLEKLDKSKYPDIVIGASPPIFANYVLSQFCAKHSIPFVYDMQDLWPEEFTRFFPGKKLVKGILKPYFATAANIVASATAVSAVSSDYLDYYKQQIAAKPAKVFHLGTETSGFADVSEEKTDNDAFNIIMLGNSQAGSFVMTAARAIQEIEGATLLAAGLKDKAINFRERISKENLIAVETLKWMEQKDMFVKFPDYSLGLVLVNTNSKSAFPNRVFSYFAAGLPVISNISGGELEKCIADNNLGITLKEVNETTLKEAMLYCRDHYDIAARKRIQAFARQHFNKEKIYEAYSGWIEKVKIETGK